MKTSAIIYGQDRISFDLFFVRRKTLEIAVYPNAHVMVKAPVGLDHQKVMKRIAKRARWIKRQIEFFKQFEPRTPQRQYVSGETHLYLGRQCRLKVRKGKAESIKMRPGFFDVTVTRRDLSGKNVRGLLEQWYEGRAEDIFRQCFERCWVRFDRYKFVKPGISIRRMKTRWGSLSRKGKLTLNVDLVRAPKSCIEYVITHELAHLKYHDHSRQFYEFLERVMPDWEGHKERLEKSLV